MKVRCVDLSIVVVNWNTRDLLRLCLASIYRNAADLDYEVIVVDNGSTDDSVEMVRLGFPGTIVVRNQENLGFARANNQAIRRCFGRHVLLLNSDAMLLWGSARQMVEHLDTNPRVGAVGGKLLNPDGTFQSSYADFPRLLGETLLLTGLSRWLLGSSYPSYSESRSQDRRPVDWVSGAFLMVRRGALDTVGLLDEDYFMYTEEVDWCYRIRRRGWEIHYLPEAQAVHWSGGTSQLVPERKRAQLYRSKWLFMRKHRGALEAATYRTLVRVMSTLKLLAWRAVGLGAGPGHRELAQQNVASYRSLLAEF